MPARRRTAAIAATLALTGLLGGCNAFGRESDRVSYNVSKEADNFKVHRRLAVINTRSDEPLFEVVGRLSVETNHGDHELTVVVKTGENTYKKHMVYLSSNVFYVVEDLNGADVSPYYYQINFLPKAIVPYGLYVGE